MAPVALMASQKGYIVSGSDNGIYPPMSTLIADSNILFYDTFNIENLQKKPDLVVVGNAVSRGNIELEYVLNNKIPYISQAEFVYREFIHNKNSIVITGTHGKTTTTSLTAWVFENAGKHPGYLIGGSCFEFSVPGRIGKPETTEFIIEGDEYDTVYYDKRSKFFHYRPDILVINNLEYDHADIFSSLDEIKTSFKRLVNMVPANGIIFANGDDDNVLEITEKAFCKIVKFGEAGHNELRLENFEERAEGFHAEYLVFNKRISLQSKLGGKHNALNSLVAMAVALHRNIPEPQILEALSSFRGVKRRLEMLYNSPELVVYDDFAHHPTAIAGILKTLREGHSQNRLITVIDLRSNTMVRNVFQEQLASALQLADVVILNEIYRKEKYKENEILNIDKLVKTLQSKGVNAIEGKNPDQILIELKNLQQVNDTIVLCSNGSFGGLSAKVLQQFSAESGMP